MFNIFDTNNGDHQQPFLFMFCPEFIGFPNAPLPRYLIKIIGTINK